jgi:hypothetical protein
MVLVAFAHIYLVLWVLQLLRFARHYAILVLILGLICRRLR